MNQNQTESKPPSVEEPRSEGLDGTPCSAGVSAPEKVWTQNMWKDDVPEGVRKIYEGIGITVGLPKLDEQDDPRLESLLVGLYSLPNAKAMASADSELSNHEKTL